MKKSIFVLAALLAVAYFSFTSLASALSAPKPGDQVTVVGGTMCRTYNVVEQRWADCRHAPTQVTGVVERHPEGPFEVDGHTRVVLANGTIGWFTTSQLETDR